MTNKIRPDDLVVFAVTKDPEAGKQPLMQHLLPALAASEFGVLPCGYDTIGTLGTHAAACGCFMALVAELLDDDTDEETGEFIPGIDVEKDLGVTVTVYRAGKDGEPEIIDEIAVVVTKPASPGTGVGISILSDNPIEAPPAVEGATRLTPQEFRERFGVTAPGEADSRTIH